MFDAKKVQQEAEQEVADEQAKKAKENIKVILRKREQAKQVLANCERELADAYAELGRATS